MHREHLIHIDAPADVVWEVWSDVTSWPEFIGSVREVELTPPRLVVGARARIVQPRIPTDDWTVAEVDPGHGWAWAARGPGVTTIATHRVDQEPDGTSTATAHVVQRGPVGTTIGWLFGPLVARYLRIELEAVRDRSEQRAAAA